MYRTTSALVLLAALSGCSPFDPELGNAPYLCAVDEPQCPDGYACQVIGAQNVCVAGSGTGPTIDSGPRSDSGPVTDGPHPDSSGACASPFSGVLATWSLTGQTGMQTSTAAGSNTSSVTAGALQRGGALTAASGTNSINSSGWSTGALDKTKYYTVTLTAPSGCSISATSLALDSTASGTGPTSTAVATSADSFASTSPGSTSTPASVDLTANVNGMLEIRVYGVGATASTGTMRIQNTLSVTGTLQ